MGQVIGSKSKLNKCAQNVRHQGVDGNSELPKIMYKNSVSSKIDLASPFPKTPQKNAKFAKRPQKNTEKRRISGFPRSFAVFWGL